MITHTELGISEEVWDALAASVEGVGFEVNLYRWNPEFTTSVYGEDDSYLFDSGTDGSYVYHITNAAMKRYASSWATVSGFSPPTPKGISPALVVDDGIHSFIATTAGIQKNSYTGSFSGFASVVTNADVSFMAATAEDSLHFLSYDATNKRTRFHHWNGSGVTDSNLYYGFPINSFDAVRVNSWDFLLFCAETPGVISTRANGVVVSKEYVPAGGILCVPFKNGVWGDHFMLDPVDQWSSYRYRTNLKAGWVGNQLVMLAFSSEGTLRTPITGYRMYTSKDGWHWSRGEILPFPFSSSQGVKLEQLDSILFGMTFDSVFTAPATLCFGTPNPTTFYPIPDEKVPVLNLNRGDMQQLSMVIDNLDDYLDSTLMNGEATLALLFNILAENTPIQQGIFEVDTIEQLEQNPILAYSLTARDRLAWLNTRTQAENFRNWEPQIVAGDNYRDTTGTGYGGMTHTAPAKESWKAAEGKLELVSSNKQGIAFSTYLNDCWNGAVESSIQLATDGNNEYAGLVFRAQDVDNYWTFRYDDNSDQLTLREVRGGDEDTKWTSSTMSWNAISNRYRLRVEFNHCRILLFYRTDADQDYSGDWTLLHTYLAVGGTAAAPINQAGYVGVIGWGFAPDPEFPEAGIAPFPDAYPPFEEPDPVEPPEAPSNMWAHEWDLRETEGSLLPINSSIVAVTPHVDDFGYQSSSRPFIFYVNLPSARIVTSVAVVPVKRSPVGFQSRYIRVISKTSDFDDSGWGADLYTSSGYLPPGMNEIQQSGHSIPWESFTDMDAAADPYIRSAGVLLDSTTPVKGLYICVYGTASSLKLYGGAVDRWIARLKIEGEGSDPF